MTLSDYDKHSERFKNAWNVGREQAEIAHIALNDMIRALRKEEPKWSINRIAQKIAGDHEALEGFSLSQIMRELDNENRQLVQKKPASHDATKTPKKEPEQKTPPPEVTDLEDEIQKDVPVTTIDKPLLKEPDYEAEYKRDVQKIEAIRAMPRPETNPLDIVVVGRYGLFEPDLTTKSLMRDLAKLKGNGWKVVELTARHIS